MSGEAGWGSCPGGSKKEDGVLTYQYRRAATGIVPVLLGPCLFLQSRRDERQCSVHLVFRALTNLVIHPTYAPSCAGLTGMDELGESDIFLSRLRRTSGLLLDEPYLLTAAFVVAYELRLGDTVSDTLDDTFRITPGFPANIRKYARVQRKTPLTLVSWHVF